MSRQNQLTAEAIRALADGQDAQTRLLEEIKRILVENLQKHADHRSHVLDAFDRAGIKHKNLEQRVADLERGEANGHG